jgi:hypothetical protein
MAVALPCGHTFRACPLRLAAAGQRSGTALGGSWAVEVPCCRTTCPAPSLVPVGVAEGLSADKPAAFHSVAIPELSDMRMRGVSQPTLSDRGSRTCDGALESAGGGTRYTRTSSSAAAEVTHAKAGCKADQGPWKGVLGGTEKARQTHGPAEGHPTLRISTCCCRSYPSWATTPRREARARAGMQSAAQPKPEVGAAAGGRIVRLSDGCSGPDPAVVAAAASWAVASRESGGVGRT